MIRLDPAINATAPHAPPETIASGSPHIIRVVVADRQPLFREAVTRVVRQRAVLLLCGEADDGRTALELIRTRRPDVAVLGRDLGGIDGFRLLNAVIRDRLPTRVLLVGTTVDQASYDAIAAGAAGWMSRFSAAEELGQSIVAAGRGRVTLRRDAQSAIARRIRERRELGIDVLSDRERRLLELLADGRSPGEAGRVLFISPATVKAILLRLYRRTGVTDRAALVAMALRRGWIS
jgi:two-component system nitrate/nitrite response regulator NarL